MPNHITNLLTVTGAPEKVAAFRAAHVTQGPRGPLFDFGTIIPKPQCVSDTERGPEPPHVGDAQVELYARAMMENRRLYIGVERPYSWIPAHIQRWGDLIAWLDETCPAAKKWAQASLRCAAETGYPGWYQWSIATWGTKWGAYSYKERERAPGRFVFEFQTAWSSPAPIFAKLADIWPELRIAVEAIDEGGGEYEGVYAGNFRSFGRAADDPERYRRVYGRDPYRDDEDEDEATA